MEKKLGDIDWKTAFKHFCGFCQDDFANYQILDSLTCGKVIGIATLVIYQMKSEQQ